MFWKKFKKKDKKEKSEVEKRVNEMIKADKIRPQFQTKRAEKKQERLKREAIGNEAYERQKKSDEQTKVCLVGVELEKAGKIDEAMKLYEQIIEENFIGNHPYDRLAIIYRKRGQLDEEIRVLKKAIWVFENIVYKVRGDRIPKLEKFKMRLKKVKLMKEK